MAKLMAQGVTPIYDKVYERSALAHPTRRLASPMEQTKSIYWQKQEVFSRPQMDLDDIDMLFDKVDGLVA